MCCFSQEVEAVSNTKIFARMNSKVQFLVYQMQFTSAEDLAMILPIPVTVGAPEDAVKFISLEDYPEVFFWMDALFPTDDLFEETLDLDMPLAGSKTPLEVHQVGCFDASFVPNPRDFSRLDERFRLSDQIWKQALTYFDYGFVVFKLAKGKNQQVHPMAFSFPTRNTDSLFFPTVHIHDGQFHPTVEFDHILYCQGRDKIEGWDDSAQPLGELWGRYFSEQSWSWSKRRPLPYDWKRVEAMQIVKSEWHCYRKTLKGENPNRDTIVPL